MAMMVMAVPSLAVNARDERAQTRRGLVRPEGRALRDDGGVFNPLGASLFWLAWGYKFDRGRLERNLQSLAGAGVDYVRALGDVGPGSGWGDREVDSRWPDHEAIVAAATDLAYDRFGLRVQWTIFGGVEHQPTPEGRAAVVDRFAAMARSRAHKVFAVEIANEGIQNGFDGAAGVAELRALAARLSAATDVPVAITAPSSGSPQALCDLYGDAAADIITVHHDRDVKGPLAQWGPVAQFLRAPVPAAGCTRRLPAVVVNNEPIGPASSVADERDPLRLAMGFVSTFLGGHAAYVLHAGAGVRGGGAVDRDAGRAADFSAVPGFDAMARALTAAKRYTPPGLAAWPGNARNDGARLVRGVDEAVSRGDVGAAMVLANGPDLFGVVLALRREVTVTSGAALTLEVLDPADGSVLTKKDLAAGATLVLAPRSRPDGDGLVLRGRLAAAPDATQADRRR